MMIGEEEEVQETLDLPEIEMTPDQTVITNIAEEIIEIVTMIEDLEEEIPETVHQTQKEVEISMREEIDQTKEVKINIDQMKEVTINIDQ